MIFVCSSREDNDAPVSADFDPRNDVPRRLNSLNRGGYVSLSECGTSAAHWGLQGQLSEVMHERLVGIGLPMRILRRFTEPTSATMVLLERNLPW